MSSADDLRRLAGPRLAHVTAAENLPLIRENGLWPAATLAERAGIVPEEIVLRTDRRRVGHARLNHQRPIVHGLRAATRVLKPDGHNPESWAAQLDTRVFFWPERLGQRFAASIARDIDISVLWIDTGAFAEALSSRIDLSPLNSGNFTQGGAHARRGDWLYVPLTDGSEAFRTNRQIRGLVQSRDSLREVSVVGSIPADILADMLV